MMMKCKCISERKTNKKQIIIGQNYFLDVESMYSDIDGDWYATVYTMDMKEIGTFLLKHFQRI